jgi:magnesium chelatase subunit D
MSAAAALGFSTNPAGAPPGARRHPPEPRTNAPAEGSGAFSSLSDANVGANRSDAALAAILFAVDPAGLGGMVLKAPAGPQRDAFLSALVNLLPAGVPVRRIPAGTPDDRLLGGLDLPATLTAGRPVAERGILAAAHGGVVVLPMAERLPAATAARLSAVLDSGDVCAERDGLTLRSPARFGVVALDEGSREEGEAAPLALRDRLAFELSLDPASFRLRGDDEAGFGVDPDLVERARLHLSRVIVDERSVETLCAVSLALGIRSLRPPAQALKAACAAAALDGRTALSGDDLTLAARLVLAPRAECWPAEPGPEPEAAPADQPDLPLSDDAQREQSARPDDAPPSQSPETPEPDHQPTAQDMAARVIAAARATLPQHLLATLAVLGAGRSGPAGKAGAPVAAKGRGRPVGVRAGVPRHGARLDLVATLRASLGWQRLRRAALAPDRSTERERLLIRKDDLRVVRTQARAPCLVIFAVDASGSLALHRLGETKGAIELLLSECYARRDEVALVAFGGRGAEVILPPTRSLARARRELAGLPGGGGTPLASGIEAALSLARAAQAKGRTLLLVVLTDGQANLALDKSPGRARAGEDALAMARLVRAARLPTLLIDSSQRPQPAARALAETMAGRYLPLPHADARTLSQAIRVAAPGK